MELGEEVGYQVRFDKRCNSDTRLLVVTTGILLRLLLDDVLLEEIGAVVIDEKRPRAVRIGRIIGSQACAIRSTGRGRWSWPNSARNRRSTGSETSRGFCSSSTGGTDREIDRAGRGPARRRDDG